jgi:uncharacterized protein YkwD
MPRGAGTAVRRLCTTIIALLTLGTAAIAPARGADLSTSYSLPYKVRYAPSKPALELEVLSLLNRERIERGLSALRPHSGLRTAARAHAQELFANGILSHVSRDGRTPVQRISNRLIRVRMVGENLAYAPDIRTAHSELMASWSHRQTILFAKFALVGVAVLDGGPYGVIVVENFSTPPPTR